MPVKLNSSGGGSVTIDVPSTASAYTLTAPAANATLITTGSSGQIIPKAALPAGSILQVVQATYSTSYTTTSGTLSATGLTASITPSSTTSKILILCAVSVYIQYTGSDYGCGAGIARNGSLVFNDSNGFNNFYASQGTGNFRNRTPYNYLDSPGTTSSVAYAFYLSAYNGQARINADSQPSTITLLEVAA